MMQSYVNGNEEIRKRNEDWSNVTVIDTQVIYKSQTTGHFPSFWDLMYDTQIENHASKNLLLSGIATE